MTLVVQGFVLHPGEQVLPIPTGASILSVGAEPNGVMLYVADNPSASPVDRKFSAIQTHWDVQGATRTFIGSAVDAAGVAWHVFEILS